MSLSKDAICNIIKCGRRYARLNLRNKTMTFLMFYEENIKISTSTLINVNLKTGTVHASGCISVSTTKIFPNTYGKQRCNIPEFVKSMSIKRTNRDTKYRVENRDKATFRNHKYYDSNKEQINTRRRERYKEQKNRRET